MIKALFRAVNQWLHRFFIRKPKAPVVDAPKSQVVIPLVAPISKEQDKDLEDLTETPNCGPWSVTEHHCPDCEKTITFDEYIKDFCKSCGVFSSKSSNGRSWRKVMHGGQWKIQLRYKNGKSKVVERVP